MSGVASGISKVFKTVASGISTAIGGAVKGVGAAAATAGAATGSSVGGLGGLFKGAGGVLGNVFSGVTNVMTKGLGGLVETGMSAGSQLLGGATATGAVGGGMAAGAAGGAAVAPSFLSKAGGFLTSEAGAGLIGGIGKGLMDYEKMERESEERQKDRNYLLGKEMRIRDSYDVPGSALPDGANTGVVQDGTVRPTPAQQYNRDFDHVYDPELGRIVRQARA